MDASKSTSISTVRSRSAWPSVVVGTNDVLHARSHRAPTDDRAPRTPPIRGGVVPSLRFRIQPFPRTMQGVHSRPQARVRGDCGDPRLQRRHWSTRCPGHPPTSWAARSSTRCCSSVASMVGRFPSIKALTSSWSSRTAPCSNAIVKRSRRCSMLRHPDGSMRLSCARCRSEINRFRCVHRQRPNAISGAHEVR